MAVAPGHRVSTDLVVTPTVFWPLIVDLYRVANSKVVRNDLEVSTLVRHGFFSTDFGWR